MAKTEEPVTFELGKNLYLQCCDCGLVHKVEYIIVGDNVILTLIRNEKLTEDARNNQDNKLTMCDKLDAAIIKEMGNPNSFLRNCRRL